MDQRKTILFLAANPSHSRPLRLGEEAREIEDALQRFEGGDAYRFKQRQAARTNDFRATLLGDKPYIVHFSGHGVKYRATDSDRDDLHSGVSDAAGPPEDNITPSAIVLENDRGQRQVIDPEALAELFALHRSYLACVLLNACYSRGQAQAINRHVRYVIGMAEEIADKAAIKFSRGFYEALAAGKSIEEAFEHGKVAVRMENVPDYLVPRLEINHNIPLPRPIEAGELSVREGAPAQTPRPEIPELLPYLGDRSEQREELKALLVQHHSTRPRRPAVCLIHGDERECHDMFLECLKYSFLPKLLKLNRDKAAIQLERLNWPATLNETGHYRKYFEEKLHQMLCGDGAVQPEALNKAIAAQRGPLLVHSSITTHDWPEQGPEKISAYLQFWHDLPDLPPGKMMIVCLFIKYKPPGSPAKKHWFRQQRDYNHEIAAFLDRKAAIRTDYHKISYTVLPQLRAVRQGDVEDWAYSKPVQNFCHHPALLQAISELYRDASLHAEEGRICMELLGSRLKLLLHQHRRDAQS